MNFFTASAVRDQWCYNRESDGTIAPRETDCPYSNPLTKDRDPFASLDILSWCYMFRVYITFLALLITLVCPTPAQVFSVTPDGANGSQPQKGQAPSGGQQLGWGSNIQNARLARAAELALEHGDRALAVDYAQRAAQAARGDPQPSFLLGYTARIDARFELSAEAYRQGLRLNPASHEGLSDLAQTYSVMGRSREAEPILVNPTR